MRNETKTSFPYTAVLFCYPEEGEYRVYQNTGTIEIYDTAIPKKVGVKHENLRKKIIIEHVGSVVLN